MADVALQLRVIEMFSRESELLASMKKLAILQQILRYSGALLFKDF